MSIINKKKIINDPIYGFITIPNDLIFDIIEHPYFQRLRRIKQLGMTYLVYPSAEHSRFSHALGTMHLMEEVLNSLINKGHEITKEEFEATQIAILLHDIGHGPFSHALEYSIVENISHEDISLIFMNELNEIFDHKLQMAIDIFRNKYKKHFLHQLVSSQLDVDRLDYLQRDSFFTGVSEGVIGTQRIIKMLEVVNDNIVIEKKGLYSVENFLNSRRIMYWQVYLHKTVLSAENMLINILKRAKEVSKAGVDLFCSPALKYFLTNDFVANPFLNNNKQGVKNFALLDDYDIMEAIKVWAQNCEDYILKDLSKRLINRNLFKVEFSDDEFGLDFINKLNKKVIEKYDIESQYSNYYVFTSHTNNYFYSIDFESINILLQNGKIKNLNEVSNQINFEKLHKKEKKHFICYPKEFVNLN